MTYEEMCRYVAAREGIDDFDHFQKSSSRKKEYRSARQICYYLSGLFLNITSIAAGEMFDQDHSTVLHARKTVINECETNKEFRKKIDDYIMAIIEIRKREYGGDAILALEHQDILTGLLRDIDKLWVLAEAYCEITGKKIIDE